MRRMRVAFSAVVWCLLVGCGIASAQSAERVHKIGWLFVGSSGYVSPPLEDWASPGAAFRERMRAHGYLGGRNFIVDRRHASGDVARLAAEADSLVASGVDVIVAQGPPATIALMQATKDIPIVFFSVSYPVEMGIVTSLTVPHRNATGTTVTTAGPKLWQLLRDVAPNVRQAGRLAHAANRPANERYAAYRTSMSETVRAEAASAGIVPIQMGVFQFNDIDPLMAELARRGDAGIVLLHDLIILNPMGRPSIPEMAVRHRLPSSCEGDIAWAKWGCLVTYAEDWDAILGTVAAQVVSILGGTKPADIPVVQLTGQKLIINTKTAKALDLVIPATLLARADEVIE